jgi:hypothetical protein
MSDFGVQNDTVVKRSITSEANIDDLPKRGRPSQWSNSRKRQLARLYTQTTLPKEDIAKALVNSKDGWWPG